MVPICLTLCSFVALTNPTISYCACSGTHIATHAASHHASSLATKPPRIPDYMIRNQHRRLAMSLEAQERSFLLGELRKIKESRNSALHNMNEELTKLHELAAAAIARVKDLEVQMEDAEVGYKERRAAIMQRLKVVEKKLVTEKLEGMEGDLFLEVAKREEWA